MAFKPLIFTALKDKVQPCEVCTRVRGSLRPEPTQTFSVTYTDAQGQERNEKQCARCATQSAGYAFEMEV